MGGLRRRLERLEEKSGYQKMVLVCPTCSEEITVYGDAPVDLIVYKWKQGQPKTDEAYGPPPHPSLVKFAEHEHDPSNFLEKTSGLPLYSPQVSGMNIGGVAHDA
jgi:hypothetical protein